MDLILLKELRRIGNFPIGVQPIHPIGAAQKNKLEHIYPSFDHGVLRKKCPNNNKIVYLCGEGFTTCCSHLALSGESSKYAHPTVEAHMGSEFYRTMQKNTFTELLKLFKIRAPKFLPEHSSPCGLCRYIFEKSRKDIE